MWQLERGQYITFKLANEMNSGVRVFFFQVVRLLPLLRKKAQHEVTYPPYIIQVPSPSHIRYDRSLTSTSSRKFTPQLYGAKLQMEWISQPEASSAALSSGRIHVL